MNVMTVGAWRRSTGLIGMSTLIVIAGWSQGLVFAHGLAF
jgi:hypothetical protein